MQRHLLSMFLLSIPSLYKFKICSIRHLTVRITYMLEYYYSVSQRVLSLSHIERRILESVTLRIASQQACELRVIEPLS